MADTKIQLRYDTASNWTTNNPILGAGEIGVEANGSTSTPNMRLKVGNGTSSWTQLNYQTGDVLSIGTVTTLTAGSAVTATITGTSPNKVLNLGIPRGADGQGGTGGGGTGTTPVLVTTSSAAIPSGQPAGLVVRDVA